MRPSAPRVRCSARSRATRLAAPNVVEGQARYSKVLSESGARQLMSPSAHRVHPHDLWNRRFELVQGMEAVTWHRPERR